MAVRFVHLCPPIEMDKDLFQDDRAAAERDRQRRYEQAVVELGKDLRAKGIKCWVPPHRGFVKVALVTRQANIEDECSFALRGIDGYELAQVSVSELGTETLMQVNQDPFGSVSVEALIDRTTNEVKWFGSLMAGQEMAPLNSPPDRMLSDLADIVAERSVGKMTDLVLPWALTTDQKKMVVARDEFAQSALSGGRFLVVASYSGAPLRPVDTRKEALGEAQKIPGFVRFVASRAALISGSSDGRVSIQTRKVAVREDGTVGTVPDGRLWTGMVDSKTLPERFRAAAKAAVRAAACMPENETVSWDRPDRPTPDDQEKR